MNYFEFMAGKGREEVALDVVEFDCVPEGVEVAEKHFESLADLWRHVARETGRAP